MAGKLVKERIADLKEAGLKDITGNMAKLTKNKISKMLVNDLKKELKDRGAPTAGKKADLCARLLDLINADESNVEHVEETTTEPVEETELKPTAEVSKAIEVAQESSVEVAVGGEGEDNEEAKEPSEQETTEITTKEEDSKNVIAPAATESRTVEASSKIEKEIRLKEAIKSKLTKNKDTKDAENSVVTMETVVATSDSGVTPSETATAGAAADSCFVRIDNFQRPLNIRSLIKWLQDALGPEFADKISDKAVWINTIKTHCYVDFDTAELADKCIAAVTGKRFPDSNPTALTAYHTTISSVEAPTSDEAKLLPGNWTAPSTKSPRNSTSSMSPMVASKSPSAPAPTSTDRASLTVSVTGNKRKVEEGSPSGVASMFKKATLMAAENPGGGFMTRKAREEQALLEASGMPSPTGGSSFAMKAVAASSGRKPLGLEDLFKKTTFEPPLYWQTAGHEVVEQRLKGKLLKGK